jgi:hypothetical protein
MKGATQRKFNIDMEDGNINAFSILASPLRSDGDRQTGLLPRCLPWFSSNRLITNRRLRRSDGDRETAKSGNTPRSDGPRLTAKSGQPNPPPANTKQQ